MSRVNVGQMGWFRGISSNGTVKKGFTIHYNYKELPINVIIEGDRFNITGSEKILYEMVLWRKRRVIYYDTIIIHIGHHMVFSIG